MLYAILFHIVDINFIWCLNYFICIKFFRHRSLGKGTPKAAPSSFGLRNDERADKRKEAKSNPKEAERLHYQPKSKVYLTNNYSFKEHISL